MIEYIFLAERADLARVIGIEYLESVKGRKTPSGWISVIKAEPNGERARCHLVAQRLGLGREPLRSEPTKVIHGINGENACNLFMHICARLRQEEKREVTLKEEGRDHTPNGDIVFFAIYDKTTGLPFYLDHPPTEVGEITAVNTIPQQRA